MTTVSIGELELPETPAARTGFFFTQLVDWYQVTGSKAEVRPRPQDHGSFDGGFDWRESATPSVTGRYIGATRADVLAAMDQVARLGRGDKQPMTVVDELRSTSRMVSIRSIQIPDYRGSSQFEFSIDMLANDPRRYGVEATVSAGVPVAGGGLVWPITWPLVWAAGGSDGRVTIQNPGTADSFPMLEVTGGLEFGFSLTLVGTGEEIRFERFIPEGSTVFLNPRTGAAWIDASGNDVSGYLTRSDWFPVPAGGTSVIQFVPLGAATGSPTLTARTAPAFW